jgi:hypothetical protein
MSLIVRQYDPFYTRIWTSLTAVQQKTLLAVIQEAGAHLQSQKVALAVGKGASTVQRALEALTDKEILREEEHEGGVRMRFEDPFLSQWIRAFPARVTGFIVSQTL